MSWSVNFIGNPENIAKALKAHSDKISGASKEEFDAVLPNLIEILKQNYNAEHPPLIKLDASGSGYKDTRSCNVSIQPTGGQLV